MYCACSQNFKERNVYRFDGSLTEESQQNEVPQSLFSLVSMILKGPNIECQSQLANKKAPLPIYLNF